MVAHNQAQKVVHARQIDLDVLVDVATSGFYLKRLTDRTLFNTIVLKVQGFVFLFAALLDSRVLFKGCELVLAVPTFVKKGLRQICDFCF